MSVAERALIFDCAGEKLIGIISEPNSVPELGVLIVVGGPQYRVGSHRQFLLLARRLAAAGIAVMRFDHRGMGDSGGVMQSFEDIIPDISAAIDTFISSCTSLERVVLWGLCDAASAALLYWGKTHDSRVAGIVLLNPWVRSQESLARTHVKHYYAKRVFEQNFWAKLAQGGVDVRGALRSFAGTIAAARGRIDGVQDNSTTRFQDRMASAMGSFGRPILLVLSGQDLTANEFLEYARANPRWRALMEGPHLERHDLPAADHTFSTAAWRHDVEHFTLEWLQRRLVLRHNET